MTLSSRLTYAVAAALTIAALLLLAGTKAHAQTSSSAQPPSAPQPQPSALRLDIPHSWNPISAYRGTPVAAPELANSPLIDALISDGVLHLSLKDAIELALENNLDLAIARYNLPIAQADILRTKAGGVFRGVNTGVVQNTGLGLGAPRAAPAEPAVVQVASSNPRSAAARSFPRTTPPSTLMAMTSTTPSLLPTRSPTVSPLCAATPSMVSSTSAKRSLPVPRSPSFSTTIASPQTVPSTS
jgi:hypothetical protein